MSTFILTWDGTDDGYAPDRFRRHVKSTSAGRRPKSDWSFGSRRAGAAPGDRVFLLRQRSQRGIVASGYLTTGEVWENNHWRDEGKASFYVDLTWDHVISSPNRLPIETLQSDVIGQNWRYILGSGQMMEANAAADLETLWASHLKHLERSWDVSVGETVTRAILSERYGGSTQGGIQTPIETSNILVFSDPSVGRRHGYDFDGWSATEDAVYYYTGAGQVGDQVLERGNKAILEHGSEGKSLRLFEATGASRQGNAKGQHYLGEFELDDRSPFRREDALDREGQLRSVLVFKFRSVSKSKASRTGDSITATPPAAAARAQLVSPEKNVAGRFERRAVPSMEVARDEATLMRELESYLSGHGHTTKRWSVKVPGQSVQLLSDTFDVDSGILYEIKARATRDAVRMAIGQLLDYGRHVNHKHKAVVLPSRPAEDLVDLISSLGMSLVFPLSDGFTYLSPALIGS